MNLSQLMQFEDFSDYGIWWYGKDLDEIYMDDNGLLKETVEISKGAKLNSRIYLVMSNLDGDKDSYYCRYRFAVKLIEKVGDNLYKWERVPIKLDEYAGRIVFSQNNKFSFYNGSSQAEKMLVAEIWRKEQNRKVLPFSGYESVELSFDELKEIAQNGYLDYKKPLSSVYGIYMVIDGNTGKQYIGSAYGPEGIWGRWNSYAVTYHGNNTEFKKLYETEGEKYFKKFKYIILQTLPRRMSDTEIIGIEAMYKNRFLTKEFGLNDN